MLFVKTSIGQVLIDVYQVSTASADVCSSYGIFISKNPASVAAIDNSRVLFSQITPYSIRTLRTNSISFIHSYKKLKYAIDIVQNGKDLFKTNHYSLTTGLKISNNINLGTKIIYQNQVKIDDYRNNHISLETGYCHSISQKLQYGLHLKYHINNTPNELYKSGLKIGTCYTIDPKLNVFLAFEMVENGVLSGNFAFEYRIQKYIGVRLGWSTLDTALGFGIVYELKKYCIEMGTSYHPQLGYSYGMGLGYKLAEIIY